MSRSAIPRGSKWTHHERRDFDTDGDDGDRDAAFGEVVVIKPASIPRYATASVAAPPVRVVIHCPKTEAGRCKRCGFETPHRIEVWAINEPSTPPQFCPDHGVQLIRAQP